MTNEHTFIADIPAYAIGALDPGDVAILESHIESCEICQTELAAYKALSDTMLLATLPQHPPAALRRRLQARLAGAQKAFYPKLAWSINRIAVGFAMLLLLALNTFSIIQVLSLQRQQAQMTRQMQTGQTALAALAYPDTRSLPISGQNISGTLLLDQERNVAVILVWNLPELQDSQTYQIWLIDPQGKRTSGGIFNRQPDLPFTSVSVISPGSLSSFTGIGVTIEPSGGSNQPTGLRVFGVDF